MADESRGSQFPISSDAEESLQRTRQIMPVEQFPVSMETILSKMFPKESVRRENRLQRRWKRMGRKISSFLGWL